jgi:ubiquinone/menaquinone biosynthesis C-methylase UbiE
MDHADHVALLSGGAPVFQGVWADLGAGSGAFTRALAELMGTQGQIIAIDQDKSALNTNAAQTRAHFPDVQVEYRAANFTQPLDLPLLDGVVMANSLHFQRRKEPVIEAVRDWLKPGGRLILVEYNVDHGNPWVPHPLSYPTWAKLAAHCGLVETRLLMTHPSRFLKEIYSAVSLKQKA